VKEAKNGAPNTEDDEVPEEADSDVEVVCGDEWKDSKDRGGDEGEAADDDGGDLSRRVD
jgi:hypothetical protein